MKFSEISRKGGLSLVFQFLGVVLSLGLNWFLTNQMGTESYNAYALSFSWIVLLSHFSVFGFDSLITREMSNPSISDEIKRAILIKGRNVSLLVSLISSLALFGIAWFLYDDYSNLETRFAQPAVLIAAAGVPLFSMMIYYRSFLKGIKKNETGMIPETLIRPGIYLLLLVCGVAFIEGVDVKWIVGFNIIAILLSFLVLLIIASKFWPKKVEKNRFPKMLWKPIFTFVFLSLVLWVNNKADIIMLSFWNESAGDVGAYNIVLKLTDFIAMPLVVLNAVFAPYLVEHFNKKSAHGLKPIKNMIRLIFIFGLVVALGFTARPEAFLSFFNEAYVAGAFPLIILAFAQLTNVLIGPVGNAMNMANSEKIVFQVSAITLVINISANAILIPLYGMLGAAISTAAALVLWNVILAIQLKRTHGTNVSIF